MGILSDLFGGTKETHSDGSTSERFSTGSITTESNGKVREATSQSTTWPLGAGEKITVTKDGDGKVVNVQKGWGK
jgi:hypothetical protein